MTGPNDSFTLEPWSTDPVACPRCGYDLRGVVATWRNTCPLEGVCTECGLDFRWTELLNRGLVAPDWHVETPLRHRRFPRRVLGTLWRSIARPLLHWRSLRMSHPIRPAAIIGYLLGLIVVAYVGVAITTALMVERELAVSGAMAFDRLRVPLFALIHPMNSSRIDYAIDPLGPIPWAAGPTACRPPLGWFTAAAQAIGLAALFLAAWYAATALVFLALPVTRRRCKVRMEHVWRIAALGIGVWTPWLVVLGGFAMLLHYERVVGGWARTSLGSVADVVVVLLFATGALTTVATPLWWSLAVRCYLRMEHAFWVGLLTCIAGLLGAVAVVGPALGLFG